MTEEVEDASESALSVQCTNEAARWNALFWKVRLVGRRGGNDYLLILPDMPTVFVELKTEKGQQSKLQKEVQKVLVSRGQRYWLVRSVLDFETRIRSFVSYVKGGAL